MCIILFQILLPSRELKGKLRQEVEDPYRLCVCVQAVCVAVHACMFICAYDMWFMYTHTMLHCVIII